MENPNNHISLMLKSSHRFGDFVSYLILSARLVGLNVRNC